MNQFLNLITAPQMLNNEQENYVTQTSLFEKTTFFRVYSHQNIK